MSGITHVLDMQCVFLGVESCLLTAQTFACWCRIRSLISIKCMRYDRHSRLQTVIVGENLPPYSLWQPSEHFAA